MDSPRDPLRKIPTKHAPEIKVDIGAGLKEARAKKGHSIDAVSQHTRIPRKFLDALENNRFEEFPALAYLRGFLKSYCDYLEIDFDAIWRQIEAPPAAPTAEPAAGKPAAPEPAPAPRAPQAQAPQAHAPKAPAAAHPSAPPPRATKSNGHPAHGAPPAGEGAGSSLWLPGVLIVAGCVVAGIGLYWLSARDTLKPVPPEPPVSTAPAVLAPLKPAAETQLGLQFGREMWVSVTVDGALKFQGRVPQGTQQDWKAQKTVLLRASDPQGLHATLDGKPYELPAPQPDGTFKIEAP